MALSLYWENTMSSLSVLTTQTWFLVSFGFLFGATLYMWGDTLAHKFFVNAPLSPQKTALRDAAIRVHTEFLNRKPGSDGVYAIILRADLEALVNAIITDEPLFSCGRAFIESCYKAGATKHIDWAREENEAPSRTDDEAVEYIREKMRPYSEALDDEMQKFKELMRMLKD